MPEAARSTTPTMRKAKDQTGTAFSLEREATYVFKKDPGGRWLCAVDNSYGTSLLRE
jgi:ketosteroid isomerase-like protein